MKALNDRELATVLAALRLWQRTLETSGVPAVLHEIATHGFAKPHLTADEIDALCERLNTDG